MEPNERRLVEGVQAMDSTDGLARETEDLFTSFLLHNLRRDGHNIPQSLSARAILARFDILCTIIFHRIFLLYNFT